MSGDVTVESLQQDLFLARNELAFTSWIMKSFLLNPDAGVFRGRVVFKDAEFVSLFIFFVHFFLFIFFLFIFFLFIFFFLSGKFVT